MVTSILKIPTLAHSIHFLSLCVWMADKTRVNVRLPNNSIDSVTIIGLEWEDGSGKNVNVRLSSGQTVFVRVLNPSSRG